MNPLILFRRPEYFFRPTQVLHRLRRFVSKPGPLEVVNLPWGAPLKVRTAETVGAGIYSYGIFDLPVCEAITRLLDPGEIALDIGANIGQMSSLMRHRVGPKGKVFAFEPHPEIFAELSANMDLVKGDASYAPISLHAVGLSSKAGEMFLDSGPMWETNRGLSKLVDEGGGEGVHRVEVERLDDILPADVRPAVCKIDVEGHEASVFAGASRLLGEGGARDIVFEDFAAYPGEVARLLEEHGYTIYRLRCSFSRTRLADPASPGAERADEPGRDYLATRDPKRTEARFEKSGWQVLRG